MRPVHIHEMRILMVFDNYAPFIGGAEVLYEHLADGLAARGHEVDVVTQRYADTAKLEVKGRVRVHRVKGNRYLFTLAAIPCVWRLARRADVIQTATYNSAVPARIAAWRWRKPVVLTVLEVLGDLWIRQFQMSRLSAALHRAFERFVVSLPFSRFVCISQATASTLRGVRRSRDGAVSVIHCGIDREHWQPRPDEIRQRIRTELALVPEDFVYLYFGRPGLSKGVNYLVDAIDIVRKRLGTARPVLILAKEPADLYATVLRRIRNLGLENEVRLLEPRPRRDLPDYVSCADCVVVPSLSEGFGFTAAEACALGVPVVVTRAGSLPEVVSGRVIFVEPADATSLADGIVAAARQQWSIVPPKEFSWATTISAHESLYRELLDVTRAAATSRGR